MATTIEIIGTEGADLFQVSSPGEYLVDTKGGADKVTVSLGNSYGSEVSVSLGGGDDTVEVDASFNLVFLDGGDGFDTFILRSGGITNGGLGGSLYKAYAYGRARGEPTPSVTYFTTSDHVDITDFLRESSGWTLGTSTTGFARLTYVRTSTYVQARTATGWLNLMELSSVRPDVVTEERIGLKLDIVTLPTITISATDQREGSNGTFTVSLVEALDHDVTVSGVLSIATSPITTAYILADTFAGGTKWSVVIAAGATSALVSAYIGEDVRAGSFARLWVEPTEAMLAGPLPTVASFAVTDNDAFGYSVGWLGAKATYENFTLLHVQTGSALETTLTNMAGPGASPSERAAFHQIAAYAQGTTSVALASYEFFTGKSPSAAGVAYLVAPDGPNANNLNSAYYQTFNLENRYINFAVNLGKVGEGKDAFAAKYGSLNLFDSTREAYKTIFGSTPNDEKVHALIDTRADYFATYGNDGAGGIGTKAAMVGWLLAEAVKADVGVYARAIDNFYMDLSDGSAQHNVDLVAVYGPGTFLDAFGN